MRTINLLATTCFICVLFLFSFSGCSDDKEESLPGPEIPLTERMTMLVSTTTNAFTVKLPLAGTVDCEINWSDGVVERVSESYPTHTYAKEGVYLITIAGTVTSLYSGDLNDSELSRINAVVNWGKTGLTTMNSAFEGCTELTSIPDDKLASLTNVTDINNAFSGCSGLTEIPAGLFDNCRSVREFRETFRNCENLTEIPAGLFDNCTQVESFNNAFSGCSGLTEIPAGLFNNCRSVREFRETFRSCENLTEIPSGLFDNCTEVRYFNLTFSGCSGLTEIPIGLFDNCRQIKDLTGTFVGCKNLTGESPYTLVGEVKVHLYDRTSDNAGGFREPAYYAACFRDCVNLSDFEDIPEEWK